MTIAQLRKEAPGWFWKGERKGMGWSYRGTCGERSVLVYAVAVLTEFEEGETQWRVDDGKVSRDYASWWLETVTH